MATETKPEPKAEQKPKAEAKPAADTKTADKPVAAATPKTEARPAQGGRSSFSVPPLVTWTLVSVGVWLIFVAIRGLSPLDEIRAALTGNKAPGKKFTPSQWMKDNAAVLNEGDGETGGVTYSSRAASLSDTTTPTNLVDVHGVKLAPSAATGFRAWEAAFGRTIVASGWRSKADQADGYAKDPGRFADPEKSWHPKGLAVDVDLAATGVMSSNGQLIAGEWDRFYAAAMATGWCNPRGPYSKKKDEAHHFSFGGCG